MKLFILLTWLSVFSTLNAQVGIGTNTPSTNSALDVNSNDKGIMLPRLNDTSIVTNPSEGLLIYDKQIQAPVYHDGIRWNTFAARATSAAALNDSITYTISGAGFTSGVFGISTISNSLNADIVGSRAMFQLDFQKSFDANSIAFMRATATQGAGMTIEFKMFASGALIPYYSIKVTNPFVTSCTVGAGSKVQSTEQITVIARTAAISLGETIYGYKNWVTNQSWAWNYTTNSSAQY
jgi:type VI protein secretion system component Hcp